jgi:cytochrome P450
VLQADFRLTDLEEGRDPYEVLAALRAVAPVAEVEGGYVAVSGHAAALDAMRQPGCASGPIALLYLDALPEGAARDEMSHRINFLDAPDHPRVRGLVAKAFTPRRVAAMQPWMEATIEGLLDAAEAHDTVDLLFDVAHQLPSLVISEMLGVPAEDRDLLTGFSDAVAPLLGVRVTPEQKAAAVAAAELFHGYLGALIDERLAAPGEDLLSALLAAEEDGERLERVELLSLVATLYSAGHRTTRDLFTNGMSVLLTEPDRYRSVVDGRWSVPDVVAELLRYETPTLYVARVPMEPVVIDGVEVEALTPVIVYLAGANRDPDAYVAPDELRPGREGPPPLSFAFGAHFCLGAALARSEAEVMLAAVTRRWPDLALAEDELRWHQRGPFRGLDRLQAAPNG